jgi:hypothetical protein
MHLIIPIIIQFYLFPVFFNSEINTFITTEIVAAEEEIQIDVLNEKMISFDFSMKYSARRKQIHIRSARPIESLRIMDASKKHRSYDVKGSSLIMLPKSDFLPGRYMAEMKFQKDATVVLAKIEVMETLKPSDL